MPKYYVKSGQIKYIVECTDHICAILAALTHFKGRGLITGPKICVSEKGFEIKEKKDCYDTDKFLGKI